MDRAIRQARLSPSLHDLMTQHRANRSIHVVNRQLKLDGLAILYGVLTKSDQLSSIHRQVKTMILGLLTEDAHIRMWFLCWREQRAQIEAAGFPMRNR